MKGQGTMLVAREELSCTDDELAWLRQNGYVDNADTDAPTQFVPRMKGIPKEQWGAPRTLIIRKPWPSDGLQKLIAHSVEKAVGGLSMVRRDRRAYYIEAPTDKRRGFWIQNEHGEGMEVRPEDLFALVDGFFARHF